MIDDPKKRRVLTIFAALLMVAFILPTYFRGSGGGRGGGGDMVLGHYGPDKTPITEEEAIIAGRRWQMLTQAQYNDPSLDPSAERRPVSAVILSWLYAPQIRNTMDISRRPEMFALLVADAKSRGIQVPEDRVQEFVTNNVIAPAGITRDQEQYLVDGVRDALTVYYGVCDIARSQRVSAPLFDAEYAAMANNVRLRVATVDVTTFLPKIPEPTPAQLSEQFEKYGDVLPGGTDVKTNPFGFGYRLPDRLRLQVLSIDRKEALRAARAKKSDYDWNVEAHKYYKQNPDHYKTDITANPSLLTPASQPAVKPFDSVKTEIEETLIATAADALAADVLRRTTSTLNADYAFFAKATGLGPGNAAATQPTTLPAVLPEGPAGTSVGVPYGSFAYLQAVAAKEQARSGLLLRVVDTGKLSSIEDLARQTLFTGTKATVGGVVVDRSDGLVVLFARAAGLIPPGTPITGNEIAPLAPASEMVNESGDILLPRIAAQSPSHKPADYKDIVPQLAEDVKLAAAFAMGRGVANTVLTSAKTNGLDAAAFDNKLSYEVTPPSPLSRPIQIKGGLTPLSLDAMSTAVRSLLRSANPSDPPLTIVELPRDKKLAVVELQGIERAPGTPPPELAASQFASQLSMTTIREIGLSWLNEKELLARTGWVKQVQ